MAVSMRYSQFPFAANVLARISACTDSKIGFATGPASQLALQPAQVRPGLLDVPQCSSSAFFVLTRFFVCLQLVPPGDHLGAVVALVTSANSGLRKQQAAVVQWSSM